MRSIIQIWKNKKRYKFNRDYQREPNAWTKQDQLYLIDSILRNVDLPKFYVRRLPNDIYEVVDGQQRLLTIWKFIDDPKFTLTEKISGEKLDGINCETLPEDLRDHFEGYDLDLVILSDFDDEMVRELFSRLQRGKSLTPAEKLNAYPGEIVNTMRKIANHPFFSKFTFGTKRYRKYLIASRIMILAKHGVCDIAPYRLYDFFYRQ